MSRLAPLLLCAWCACCACSDTPTGDAGLDAAAADGGGDVGRRDAGPDALVADAGADAPLDGADDPTWLALPGLHDECLVERAAHPERVEGVELAACEDAAGTCEEVRWVDVTDARIRAVTVSAGVTWIEWYLSTGSEQTLLLVAADGTAAVRNAWRVPAGPWPPSRLCDIGVVGLGGGHVVHTVMVQVPGGELSEHVFVAPLATLESLEAPRRVLSESELRGGSFQWVGVGAEGQIGAQLILPLNVLAMDATDVVRIMTDTLPAGQMGSFSIVGDTVFWTHWTSSVDVAFGSAARDGAVFRSVPGAEIPWFLAEETELVWYEGRGGRAPAPYTTLELWTAPYTDDPALLTPRRVLELPSPDRLPIALGDGLVARWPSAPNVVELIDLVDGRTRHYALPPPYRLVNVAFVSAERVWLRALDGATTVALSFDPRELPYE